MIKRIDLLDRFKLFYESKYRERAEDMSATALNRISGGWAGLYRQQNAKTEKVRGENNRKYHLSKLKMLEENY